MFLSGGGETAEKFLDGVVVLDGVLVLDGADGCEGAELGGTKEGVAIDAVDLVLEGVVSFTEDSPKTMAEKFLDGVDGCK